MRQFKLFGIVALIFTLATPASPGERNGSPFEDLEPGGEFTVYVLNEMAAALGSNEPPDLYRAPVDSARAVILGGDQAIVYNPDFFEEISVDAGTDWAAISVLAHELGHHHYGHVVEGHRGYPTDVSRRNEIEADYFSGYVLARLGTTLREAEAAQLTYFDEHATPTHPASPARLKAIETGWRDAQEGRELTTRPADAIRRKRQVNAPRPEFVIGAMTGRLVPEGGW